MQDSENITFTIQLTSDEAAMINDALRVKAGHHRTMRTKAVSCNMHRCSVGHHRQALLAEQLADKVCIAHANAQEVALDHIPLGPMEEMDYQLEQEVR